LYHKKIAFATIVTNWLGQEILPKGFASLGVFSYSDTNKSSIAAEQRLSSRSQRRL